MAALLGSNDLGSLNDVPGDLLGEIKRLEQMFIVEAPKLKEITNHFIDELAKGSLPSKCCLMPMELTDARPERGRRKHCQFCQVYETGTVGLIVFSISR